MSRISFETRVLVAFTAAVLVVTGLAVATWTVAQDAAKAVQWVSHTREVLDYLVEATGDSLELELSMRRYAASGDAALLVKRDATIAEREARLHRIKELTVDNASQQERWTRLRAVIDDRLEIFRHTELLHRTQGSAAANAYVSVSNVPLQQTRERMHRLLGEMEEEERRLLEDRSGEQSRASQRLVRTGALFTLLLFALLVVTYVQIRRQLRETEASQRALAENEQSLSTTLHSIGDAVLVTDTAGRIARMNPVAQQLTGWPFVEAQNRSIDEVFCIINEHTRAPAEVPVARVLASGEIQGLANHTVLIARDGSEHPIADSAAPIRDAHGRVSGVVLVFRDVSVERQAQRSIQEQNELLEQRVRERTAQLHESEERYHLLVDGVKDYAIIMLDPQGHVLTWNEGARRLKGYAEAEIVGQSMECFYSTEDIAAGKPARLLARATAEGRYEDEGWRVRKDGSRFIAEVILTAIRDSAGALLGFAKITRDITERKNAEQLRALSRHVLESIVSGQPLAHVLEHLVREVELITPAMLGSILLLDADGVHLRHGAAPSLPEAYKQAIDGVAIGPSVGSCGSAAWRRAPVIVTDIESDPLWVDYRELALAHGLRACWSTPILSSAGKVLGTFAMYYREPRDPSHEHHELIGHISNLATVVIERIRDAEQIRNLNAELEQRVHELERVSRALRTLSAGNRALLRASDEQGLLDSMCQAIVDAGGYHMALVCYRDDDKSLSLRPMAESGYPGGLDALRKLKESCASDEYGRRALDTSIRTGQPSVVRNRLSDPDYVPWWPHQHGKAVSSVACPLLVEGRAIGALAICATEPDAFGADEVKLLSELADDLAFGIAVMRARVEQQQTQAAMDRLTRFDALTGLPNEAQFIEWLTTAIDTGNRMNQAFVMLQINIARLREINDALGFSSGDQLLREFGARLSAAAPEPALVARLRGDEFAILLPDSNASAAASMALRLEGRLAQPFLIADVELDVLAKIGIAVFPDHGSTPHDLLRRLDRAVQQAKEHGNGYTVFDPAQNPDRPHRLKMAGELRRAIEGGDLRLYLQPKVEIATGRICGAEGLVRWRHTERGLIAPSEFIDLAEQTGLIKPLTEWVIEACLRLNHAWQRQGCELPIAVNLSARNLTERDLIERLNNMRNSWGVAAGLLELEITESTVMDDPELALLVLTRIRDEGIPLYIDDFGTGYSSLSYLQKLPVEYIKIDQSFVHDMLVSKDTELIVRSTIDLVHDLGRKAVAEGVETQQHWDQLAALGCDIAQGYFIARPMPAEEFQSWVRQFRAPAQTAG